MRSQDEVAAMQCPVCRVPLAMSDRQGIEIDYCPQCRGVWLDRGELDKIIDRSAPAPEPVREPAPQQRAPQQASPWGGDDRARDPRGDQRGGYGSHTGHGYGHHGKRKKSWLEDIFD